MFKTITPIDNTVYLEREYDSAKIEDAISNSVIAQKEWASLEVNERVELLKKFVSDFLSRKTQISEEVTWQIGRPMSQVLNELKGFKERADYMFSVAEKKLSTINLPRKDGFKNYIKRIPLGVSFIVAPWNYPYLTSVNSIIPALAAGNTVILKHSAQTPLCAEQLYLLIYQYLKKILRNGFNMLDKIKLVNNNYFLCLKL